MSQVNKAFEAGEGGEWKNGSEKVRGVSAVSREVTKKLIFHGNMVAFSKFHTECPICSCTWDGLT